MSLQKCYVIRIYIPVRLDELGNKKEQLRKPLRHLPYVAKIIDVISSSQHVGILGHYSNVFEITEGEEWYTPQQDAQPRLGDHHQESGVHSVILTTYAVDIDRDELDTFIEEVVRVHPWEHPVIECIGPEGPLVWLPHSPVSPTSLPSQMVEPSLT
jgi:hypothetical protein